jgi:integrase
MAKLLTVAGIENRKPDRTGKRIEDYDKVAPGLVVRTAPTGAKTYAWRGRIRGRRKNGRPADPIIITLGPIETLKLDEAREQARNFWKLAREGTDPREKWRAKNEEGQQLFETLAEAYILDKVSKLRSKTDIEAAIRRYLIKPWKGRPVVSITRADVSEVIRGILDDGKTTMARLVLSYTHTLFRWAGKDARGKGRLKTNPATGLSAKNDFDITNTKRQVGLGPDHLAAIWNAADKTPYPAGPYFKMLLLSGQRRSEVSDMAWSELDLDRDKVWIIPASRMKAKRAHEVPLSPAMLALLLDLREKRGKSGDYVFSTDRGKRSIGNFSKLKADLDAKIKELSPDLVMPAWTIHDLRRAVRTGHGAIPSIPQDIRELVIGHIPSTLIQTYDLHGYRDEKRQALTLWADRLAGFINPSPVGDNVVTMRATQ